MPDHNVDWDLYIKLLGIGDAGDTDRADVIRNAIELFESAITSDPSYHEEAQVNNQNQPLAVDRDSALVANITAMPGDTLHTGDMVYVFDENWIVTEVYVDDIGLVHGTIWMCNDILTFQNHSPEIYGYACVIDDGSYSKSGLNNDVSVLSNTYKIYLSLDDITKYMFIDKRLSVGRTYDKDGNQILEVYKVIGIDLKSKNIGAGSHLMVMTVLRDVYDSKRDNFAYLVCDYIPLSSDEQEHTLLGTCSIDGLDQLRIGTRRKYVGKFWHEGEDVSSQVTPVWVVEVPDGVVYTVNEDKTCTITVPLDSNLIGKKIELSLSDSEGLYGNYTKEVVVMTIG